MTLQTYLQQSVDACEKIGFPAIKERFLLRNGRAFERTPLVGRRMQAKECYTNSFIKAARGVGAYVEGVAMRPSLPIAISHAWNAVDGKAMDFTWRRPVDPTIPDEAEYFGVEFPFDLVRRVVYARGFYGLLEGPAGMLNIDLMFEMDPELAEIAERIMGHPIKRSYSTASI